MSTEETLKIKWQFDEELYAQLSLHEDKRSFPYVDSVGKVSIGIGRNLDDRGLSPDEIDYLYRNDIELVVSGHVQGMVELGSVARPRQEIPPRVELPEAALIPI